METQRDSEQQGRVDGLLMRGGTSKGLFVRKSDLPIGPDHESFEDFLLELYGSPDPLQVDGIGGSHSHTSKIMMVSTSDRDDADVEYTFGGVGVENPVIEWGGNCGNLTAAVGGFAILENLVEATDPVTTVRLYNTNADALIEQEVPVADGEPAVYGDYSIDGVPGTGARVDSHFLDPAGGVLDSLLPTGNAVDRITVDGEALDVSIVDVTNVVAFVRASDIGLTGTELPAELESDPEIMDRLERIRGEVCVELGLVDEPGEALYDYPIFPHIAFVSEPQSYDCSIDKRVDASEIDITARVISMQSPHHAYAMTSGLCLGATARLPGTIPNEVVRNPDEEWTTLGHPKGTMSVGAAVTGEADDPTVERVSIGRTCRPIMWGSVYYRYLDELRALKSTEE
ncbi:2-methylaconitate cis-trans isomerase PrpF family protein [Salinigranum marinum]|uniref:2-methylaconitate cis-trans isomerase PrpF family protein n=1 Tax=Salinigranum marinum TaxID=1515595 RepID=UPI002989DA55|nr:PrpF domain-containing protein [Salinigranum marinum]